MSIRGLRSGRALVLVLSLLLTGGASASAIVLTERGGGGTTTQAAPGDLSAGKKVDNSPHPIAGNFKPDDTKVSDCHAQSCYEQAFGNLSYDEGPKAALKLFDQKIASDRAIEAGCHRIAHFIGSAALARYHGNVSEAFSQGSSSCWSGYYHGILERSFWGVSSIKKVGEIARTVCSDPKIRVTSWLAYQCVHGLGHGLMIYTGLNLPLSLSICDRLITKWDQTSCTGGVFMENITPSGGARSPWLKKNDLVYPCDAVKEHHKIYCYLMVTSRILQANGYNWKATASICSKVERAWVATCFQSYGRDADGNSRQNAARDLALCRIAGLGFSDCLYGAARDMTSNYANGVRAAQLCASAPAGERSRCFFGVGTVLGGMSATPSGRRALCTEITTTYLRPCLRGEGLPS